jgi:hypothetical protein
MGQGSLEGVQHGIDLEVICGNGLEDRAGPAIGHVIDELVAMLQLFLGLGAEPGRDAGQVLQLHLHRELAVDDGGFLLHGDLAVECFFELACEFHAAKRMTHSGITHPRQGVTINAVTSPSFRIMFRPGLPAQLPTHMG